MWDLPGPGLEPVSPALAGGFLTTAPPVKPMDFVLMVSLIYNSFIDVNLAEFLKSVLNDF